eukprot:m.72389 g.72389  ORF g.72389 m.72389 type:complete len:805 (+) comp12322_c0_seq2:75-2489(+)
MEILLKGLLLMCSTVCAAVNLVSPPNVQCDGHTRFTLISPIVVRAEWSPNGAFEDGMSLAVVNRAVPSAVKYVVSNETNWCNITVLDGGNKLVISYNKQPTSKDPTPIPFKTHQLQMRNVSSGGFWQDDGLNVTTNLGGTVYSLSGVDGATPLDACSERTDLYTCTLGVLSRDGVAVYNDGENNFFDDTNGWWRKSHYANKNGQDLYIFMYGKDFRSALQALGLLTGPIRLPPRRFFGVWWSRWQKYSQQDFEQIIDDFQESQLPLDGINLDTEWHRSSNYLDWKFVAHGEKTWYSGLFDWDTTLYPNPQKMVQWLDSRGLWPVWFDIHQADGVQCLNSKFGDFAKQLGLPGDYDKTVPLDVQSKTYMEAFFQLLNSQVNGSNYWWLDNPQDMSTVGPDFNAGFWDRIQFFLNSKAQGQRPTVMGPWGGLGTHRYPFVHSGDVITSWESLKFSPRYTSTAANVLLGYITHDIGGHRDYGGGNNPELYLRNIQYGIWTAMFRPHGARYPKGGTGDTYFERRFWEFPYAYYKWMREAIQLRAQLVPHVYSEAINAYLTSIPMIRRLYVDWPEDENVYGDNNTVSSEYMLGESILVAPIVTPMNESTNLTYHEFYLPSLSSNGQWVEWQSGRCFKPANMYTSTYNLGEMPVFVKAGSIIPLGLQPTRRYDALRTGDIDPPCLLGSASVASPKTISWNVFIGNASQGSGVLYEDDGLGTSYENNSIAETKATYEIDGLDMRLTVAPVSGDTKQTRLVRDYEWKIRNVLSPSNISIVSCTSDGSSSLWDAETLTATVLVLCTLTHNDQF